MVKSYSVTLAKLAWIKGTVLVEAGSFKSAFKKAKDIADQASWPVDEDGDTVGGFGDLEIDRAYCDAEDEPDHDGEPISADINVYRAAPAMLEAIKATRSELKTEKSPDGRILSIAHADDGLRKIVALLDAVLAIAEPPDMSEVPQQQIERLLRQRNEAMHDPGESDWRQGLVRDQIAKMDAELLALGYPVATLKPFMDSEKEH